MTDKEATVYIVDVGKSMGAKRLGRDVSDLDWAMVYVWDKMTTIVALDRKTTFQAVLALRSDRSYNELMQDDGYKNIYVLQEMKALQRQDLKELQKQIMPSKTNEGDAVDAVVVAIDMITKHCKKLKYKRRIILVTDGRGQIDPDQIPDIAEKLKDDEIELIVLGIDFDDAEYGFSEKDKPGHKRENESFLKQLADDSKGVFGTLAQAIEELGQPRVKSTRPIASFKGTLTIGSPSNQYGNSLVIAVERYPKVMVRKPPSASTVRTSQQPQTLQGDDTMDVDQAGGATALLSERNYYVDDETQPGNRRDVDQEELVRGYEYGRSVVPLSESEQNITRLETEPCLDILGFVSSNDFPRQMLMTTSHIIIGSKGDAEATMALSSLIHALSELEDYAVARFVAKKDKAPLVVLLAPLIEPDYECLVELELPFAEDVRTYRFAPLDKILTVGGKEVTEHTRLPNDDLKQAMSDYVDRMDLTTFGDDEEGNPTEYGKIDDIYSPLLHRLDQAIRWRATNDTQEIPPPYPILLKYAHPPEDLVTATESQLSALKSAAKVEKVTPQAKSRRTKPTTNPISGLDIAALLEPASQIDPNNSIPSFERMVNPPPTTNPDAPGPDPDRISKASKSLTQVIEKRVKESFGSLAYERALEEMGHLRRRLDELEEPRLWNDWIEKLKGKIAADELGDDRFEFWRRVRDSRLGLLFVPPRRPAGVSSAEVEAAREKWMLEAKNFWSLK